MSMIHPSTALLWHQFVNVVAPLSDDNLRLLLERLEDMLDFFRGDKAVVYWLRAQRESVRAALKARKP